MVVTKRKVYIDLNFTKKLWKTDQNKEKEQK